MRRMYHTEAVTLRKDFFSFKWIAEDDPCVEDFSLLLFGNFLKYFFTKSPD